MSTSLGCSHCNVLRIESLPTFETEGQRKRASYGSGMPDPKNIVFVLAGTSCNLDQTPTFPFRKRNVGVWLSLHSNIRPVSAADFWLNPEPLKFTSAHLYTLKNQVHRGQLPAVNNAARWTNSGYRK